MTPDKIKLTGIGFLLSLLAFWLSSVYFSTSQAAVLACIVLMLFYWTTEAIAMPITALLPVFVFSAAGLMPMKQLLANYAHPVVYLFFGGFVLALGLQRWKIDQWLSQLIIRTLGKSPARVLAGFSISTALLSMWISNTATAVMMLPLAQSVLAKEEKPVFERLLYLSIAFSANIGGIATLIGTPPNVVLAALYKERYGIEISFAKWLQFGLPISLLLLGLMYLLFIWIWKRSGEDATLNFELGEQNFKLNKPQKRFLAVFVTTALLWTFRPLLQSLFPLLDFLDDTYIALAGAAALFVVPGGNAENTRLLQWNQTQELPWGILLIFGGGLSLALGIEVSGLSTLLGEALMAFNHWHLLSLMLLVAFFGLFATELMSNVALVSVFIPVVFLLCEGMGIEPHVLAVPLTLAASCAFMLPIATPPNMVVYASGKVSFGQMAAMGWRLNLVSLVLIVLFWYFLGSRFF